MKYFHIVSDSNAWYDQVSGGTLDGPNVTVTEDGKAYFENLANDQSNPALMEIARNAGWVAQNATAMTYEDAYNVTNEQFNNASVSVAQDGAVNGYDSTFKNLEHFEEFKYFTQVTSTTYSWNAETSAATGGFFNATKLYSIKFPVSLKRLGARSFMYCKSLRSVEFPPNCQGMEGQYCFVYTNQLSKVKFNESYNVISNMAFYTDDGVACEFDIPDNNRITMMSNQSMVHYWHSTLKNPVLRLPNIVTYGYEVWIHQVGPKEIHFGPRLKTLGGGSAYTGTYNDIFNPYLDVVTVDSENPDIKAVNNIVYQKDGTVCYGGADYGLSKQKTVTVAEGVTLIVSGAFRDLIAGLDGDEQMCPWFDASLRICENLVLPSTLTTIGDRVCQYSQLKRVVIYATTPPTRNGMVPFISSTKIYVPSEALQAYKTAWSNQASKIEAITQDVLNAL